MTSYAPPFEYTANIVSLVAEVSELVGKVTVFDGMDPNPVLRRANRIRTIHSSLLIENNTLTLDQVTAVLDGKHVLASPKDVREVQNAYEAYEAASVFNPYSLDDLLKAHALMMDGLVKHPGCLRTEGVGVYAGNVVVHAAPPQNVVPQLMQDLFGWLGSSNDHPLIKGSVFHYEFEFIHPFMDGNGRTGRLWHSLLLREWRPVFAWIPVETLIHQNQQAYYDAIMEATNESSSTPFIEFMLSAIHKALIDVLEQQEAADQRVATGKQPDTAGKQPDTAEEQPDTAEEQPDTAEKQPDTAGKQPDTAEKQPDTATRQPDNGKKRQVGSDRDAQVTAFLSSVGQASASDIATLLGLSADRTRAVLRDMARRGVIQKYGSARATRYGLKR